MSAEITFLNRVRNHNGLWMAEPRTWVWNYAGGPQGPGLLIQSDPGLANLFWLAMDMDTAPRHYSMRDNALVTILVLTSANLTLAGLPLRDQAASLTLRQFRELCLAEPKKPNSLLDLLALLALKRLDHAHT